MSRAWLLLPDYLTMIEHLLDLLTLKCSPLVLSVSETCGLGGTCPLRVRMVVEAVKVTVIVIVVASAPWATDTGALLRGRDAALSCDLKVRFASD